MNPATAPITDCKKEGVSLVWANSRGIWERPTLTQGVVRVNQPGAPRDGNQAAQNAVVHPSWFRFYAEQVRIGDHHRATPRGGGEGGAHRRFRGE
jgi:hypothetical protein